MSRSSSQPRFDHGAALRVPSAADPRGWRALWAWLGDAARAPDEAGAVQVRTADGFKVARPGDWIVLSVSGAFHVARVTPMLDA
ncbi:MAG: hypothetical protein Q8M88_03560 [Phenylobacterium sp.]|uniref:hypothetical protein n=1 Tax=Phenylobacterium sp. TaxID=1871053 RepID=UPI0027354109|nr:hypothetical protein [Phenylobacterium sp.]MDP3173494.1 hypothetical protein [Phenylobacterium sp.]